MVRTITPPEVKYGAPPPIPNSGRKGGMTRDQLKAQVLLIAVGKMNADFQEINGPDAEMSEELRQKYLSIISEELEKNDGYLLEERFKDLSESGLKDEVTWLVGQVYQKAEGY